MKFLKSLIDENGWPGVTGAIVLPEQAETLIAAGHSDRETGRLMDPHDRMLAGSIGKTFAAAAALTLVEDKLVDLDEPITRFRSRLPWITDLPDAEKITLRRLLSHRAGLANYIYVDEWRQRWMERVSKNPDYAPNIEDSIRIAIGAGQVCAPDTETRYADTNYLIVGRLIEATTGRDYYDYLQERILDPLGLRDTSPQITRRVGGLVPGYIRAEFVALLGEKSLSTDGALIYDPSWEYCGGGLVSTASDLARFMAALFQGRIHSERILKEMLTTWPMDYGLPSHRYGLGVQRFESDWGPAFGHTGQFTGYRSFAFFFERSRIAVAMQVNADAEQLVPAFMKLARFAHSFEATN